MQTEGGQTIAVELYATGFSNTVGLSAAIAISDPTAIAAVSGEKKQGYSFPADPIKWSSGASEIEFNEGTLAVSAEAGSNLKLVGVVQITLAQGFSAFELTLTSLRFDYADGTSQIAEPNLVMTVVNLGRLPKLFSADFNLDSGNQNSRSRFVNPGVKFPVQLFASGVKTLTSYEIRAQIDTDEIDAASIEFVPRRQFVVSVPGADGGIGDGGTDASRISADIQSSADESLTDSRSIQAGSGESVTVELYATGFSNTVGLTATLTLDNPSAVSTISGEKKQGYSFPASPVSWTGGSELTFNEGTLATFTEEGSDLKLIGILTFTMATSEPLNIAFAALNFDFADGNSESATSDVILAVNGTGGDPSGGGSATTGDESRASIDVQDVGDDVLTSGKNLEVAGGETVLLELFATGFSNTVGLTAVLGLDNPGAVTEVSGEKKQGYSFPANPIKWNSGDATIEFNEGTLAVPNRNGLRLETHRYCVGHARSGLFYA